MKTIFKYSIPITDDPLVDLPKGAKFLSIGAQGELLFLWAEVDDDKRERVPMQLHIRGTGHEMKGNEGAFITTVIMYGGALVWHIFADKEE